MPHIPELNNGLLDGRLQAYLGFSSGRGHHLAGELRTGGVDPQSRSIQNLMCRRRRLNNGWRRSRSRMCKGGDGLCKVGGLCVLGGEVELD